MQIQNDRQQTEKAITLHIDGMSCQHCVRAVDEALGGVAGVASKEVEIGTARVTYDAAETTPDVLAQAVEAEGYEVKEVEGTA